MVLDRRIFRAVGLVVGIVLLVGLLALPVWAQAANDQYEDQNVSPTGDCPGAQEVLTVDDTGITQTETFDIEGDNFRITSDVEATAGEDFLIFQIFVQDENGDPVAVVSQEEEGTKTSFINEGPGQFSLDINGANASYTVLVEDCVGSDDTPNGDDNNGDDDNDADDDDIINVPNKDLPKTGGPPLLGIAFFILAGAGLLTAVVRRRR